MEVINMIKKDIELKDLRGVKSSMKGHIITAGMELNESNVKVMLTKMGVNPTPEMIQEAIGYMSANGAEINMNNLADFLRSKDILHSASSVIDLRTTAKKK